jgi:hypothetical protein
VQVEPDAQSVLVVHIVLQTAFVVSHENGAQLVVEDVHWPAALQAEVVSVIPSGQLTGAQVGSVVPGATGAHAPRCPVTAQLWQLPQGPLEQQTPSVHRLLRHSVPDTQETPSGLRLVQEPDWQV